MNHIFRFVMAAALAAAIALLARPLVAQSQEGPAGQKPASANGDAPPEVTLADIEAGLAAMEKDTAIEIAVKDVLRPKYQQAIDTLKEAAEFATRAVGYGEAVQTAPASALEFRNQMRSLPSVERAARVNSTGSTQVLQEDVEARRAALAGLNGGLSQTISELAHIKGRPAEISARVAEVQRELSDITKRLSAPDLASDETSPSGVAERILVRARKSKLVSELEALKQEQLSQSVRDELLQAQQELLTRQIENSAAALSTLEALSHQRLTREAERVSSLADTLPQDMPSGDADAQALAVEVRDLAKEFEDVVSTSNKVTSARNDVLSRNKDLTSEYDGIREQLKLGGGGGALAQLLFELDRRVLGARADVLTVRLPTFDQTRLDLLQVETKLRKHPQVAQRFVEQSSAAVAQLVTTRQQVLEKLKAQYGNLTRALAALDGDRSQYLDQVAEVRDYIRDQLFWMRSSPPIGAATVTYIPSGLRWAFKSDHWIVLGRALQNLADRLPVACLGIVFLVAASLLMRRWMGAALRQTGVRIRRISTDRYAHTGEALLWTTLLAVPVPLLIGFVAWGVKRSSAPSDWLQGFTDGLWLSACVLFGSGFLAAACRPGGLGAVHFGWREATLAVSRRAIRMFTVVYIPALLLTMCCKYGQGAQYFDSVGRVSFLLAHVWTALVLWRLFRHADGLLAEFFREKPTRLLTRWRYLWLPLVNACPLALVILAGMGYLFTAVELSLGLLSTTAFIAGGCLLYYLALRWFLIKQRKLALAEALARRRARLEAAALEGHQEESRAGIEFEDEAVLDLDAVSGQTQALLRLLCTLSVAGAILVLWSRTFPLISVLGTIPVPLTSGLTLLELARATIIGIVTHIAVRNLPGLLELAVLRATSIEAGTRNAITTLCQYAAIATGLMLVLNVLQVDWAKFGWIAAALSVGLGFGLQEVVANFVCGLILLFERPIRVGDIVTLEGTTGTVTKIHLRATTITNWDRQDFVVPNKTLITGTILNWTLSASVNRIVLPVGVAYGSDTDEARQILVDVAANHSLVLNDPAPMATFERFDDSSLNLVLRAYLPNLDNRLKAISELHTEIDKRFAAAGIEIAFPQRDLHLRSGWDGTQGPGSSGTGNGKQQSVPPQTR